jgi:ribosomal protein S17
MKAKSITLFGNKMLFEIYLKDVNVSYKYRAHNSQGEEKDEVRIEDKVLLYEDTLVSRNNSFEMINAKGNSSDGIFHLFNLEF